MTRQFTEHELAMQNFDAMREEEFLRAFDAIYDTIIAALDEARANFENDNDIEVKEMFPGTMAALDDLKERFTPEEIEQERDANIRKNSIWSRKYYLAALTDATKVVKITLTA